MAVSALILAVVNCRPGSSVVVSSEIVKPVTAGHVAVEICSRSEEFESSCAVQVIEPSSTVPPTVVGHVGSSSPACPPLETYSSPVIPVTGRTTVNSGNTPAAAQKIANSCVQSSSKGSVSPASMQDEKTRDLQDIRLDQLLRFSRQESSPCQLP